MGRHDGLDRIDRNILRIFSLYEDLDLLQLWYELGESNGSVEVMNREELLRILESLGSRGFVKCVGERESGMRWAVTPMGKAER